MNYFTLAAAAAATSGSDAAGASCLTGGGSILIMYAVVIGLCYLLFLRPQKKKRQQEEELHKNIEVGDEIITIGGICGRIVSIKDDETIVVETGADRTKIKMKNWAVSSNETARERYAAEHPEGEKKSGVAGLFSGLGKKKDEKESEDE